MIRLKKVLFGFMDRRTTSPGVSFLLPIAAITFSLGKVTGHINLKGKFSRVLKEISGEVGEAAEAAEDPEDVDDELAEAVAAELILGFGRRFVIRGAIAGETVEITGSMFDIKVSETREEVSFEG